MVANLRQRLLSKFAPHEKVLLFLNYYFILQRGHLQYCTAFHVFISLDSVLFFLLPWQL